MHKHSNFSQFDAIPSPEDYAKYIAENKDLFHQVLCISEHGNLQSLFESYKQAKKHNLLFMPACEFYFQEEFSEDKTYYHMLVFGTNESGYYELIDISNQIIKAEHVIAPKRKPRAGDSGLDKLKPILTLESLANCKNLYVSGACIGGYWNKPLSEGEIGKGRERLGKVVEIVGREKTLVELQTFYGEQQYNVNLYNQILADEFKLKTIIASDAHVIHEEDCRYISIARAMGFKMTIDVYRKAIDSSIHNTYLKSYNDYLREASSAGISKYCLDKCVETLDDIYSEVNDFSIERKQEFRIKGDS